MSKKITFSDILKTTLISDENNNLIQKKELDEPDEPDESIDEVDEQIDGIEKQNKDTMIKKITKDTRITIDDLKGKVIDLSSGVINSATTEIKEDRGNRIILENAQSRMAEILAPNYGSDREHIEQGKVDVRRFSNIKPIDVIWLTHFLNVPSYEGGEYSNSFCTEYLNLRYSVGGEHKKIGIKLQQALNSSESMDDSDDNRNWIEKHITKRGQEPDEPE